MAHVSHAPALKRAVALRMQQLKMKGTRRAAEAVAREFSEREKVRLSPSAVRKYLDQLHQDLANGIEDPLSPQSAHVCGSQVSGDRNRAYRSTLPRYAVLRGQNEPAFLNHVNKFAHKRGRLEGKPSELNVPILREIWQRQQGVCAVTGLPMDVQGEGHGLLVPSLDRIVSKGGYTRDNVRFVCLFYNHMKKDFSDASIAALLAANRVQAPAQLPARDDVGRHLCKLLRYSRARAREKQLPNDLSRTFLEDLYLRQGGLCALSGVPMAAGVHCPQSMSIDRIDSAHGYVQQNVQLTALSANLAKNRHSQEEFVAVLERAREALRARKEQESGAETCEMQLD